MGQASTSLKLQARTNRLPGFGRRVLKVIEDPNLPHALRDKSALLTTTSRNSEIERQGFALTLQRNPAVELPGVVGLPKELDYLRHSDVICYDGETGALRVLFRSGSNHNTFLLTEQCNSKCLMCSQPPKTIDDSYLATEVLDAIPFLPVTLSELGISGGEPTLMGPAFLQILQSTRDQLPNTRLHVLSNGRSFAQVALADQIAAVRHHALTFGVPLYSDVPWMHDYVVQSKGAFSETVIGLQEMGARGINIELRIVIHALTVPRLRAMADFIARHLPFVRQVSLMGIEPIGYARTNWSTLWVDPIDYQNDLESTVDAMVKAGLNPLIFNHQLCTLKPPLWPYAVKSISDWKNIYLDECRTCLVRAQCGGFFAWAPGYHSRAIRPLESLANND